MQSCLDDTKFVSTSVRHLLAFADDPPPSRPDVGTEQTLVNRFLPSHWLIRSVGSNSDTSLVKLLMPLFKYYHRISVAKFPGWVNECDVIQGLFCLFLIL